MILKDINVPKIFWNNKDCQKPTLQQNLHTIYRKIIYREPNKLGVTSEKRIKILDENRYF